MLTRDCFHGFLFEQLGLRGEIVHLDASWRTAQEHHAYPEPVRILLGQSLAAVLLLSATIKFKGSLILQIQGDGPLTTLVAQATHDRTIRGIAHWNGEVPEGPLSEIFGNGRLVLTVQREGAEPYQGMIPLEGTNLASAIESYFALSEQLATKIWLAADGHRAAGLFLQELPSQQREADAWRRISMLADTVTDHELLELPTETLLRRLFHEERVRMFDPDPVIFRCSCSQERIEAVLLALGRPEVDSIIAEQGAVEARCEFCNRLFQLDSVDIGALFARETAIAGSRRRH